MSFLSSFHQIPKFFSNIQCIGLFKGKKDTEQQPNDKQTKPVASQNNNPQQSPINLFESMGMKPKQPGEISQSQSRLKTGGLQNLSQSVSQQPKQGGINTFNFIKSSSGIQQDQQQVQVQQKPLSFIQKPQEAHKITFEPVNENEFENQNNRIEQNPVLPENYGYQEEEELEEQTDHQQQYYNSDYQIQQDNHDYELNETDETQQQNNQSQQETQHTENIEIQTPQQRVFGFIKPKQQVFSTDNDNEQKSSQYEEEKPKISTLSFIRKTENTNIQQQQENQYKKNPETEQNEDLVQIQQKPVISSFSFLRKKQENENVLVQQENVNQQETENEQIQQQETEFIEQNHMRSKLKQQENSFKKEKSVTLNIEDLDVKYLSKELNERLSNIRCKISEVIKLQNNIGSNKKQLQDDLAEQQERLTIIEQRQSQAIEQENFEEADRLEVNLKQTHEKIGQIQLEITKCEQNYNELEQKKEGFYKQELICHKQLIEYVNSVMEDKSRIFQKNEEEEKQIIQQENLLIEDEKERLKIIRNHLDLNTKHIEEENNQLGQELGKQTKDFKQSQDKLIIQKTELELIIQRLAEELKLKQEELQIVDQELNVVNSKIDKIMSKFGNQMKTLQSKKERIHDEKQQYEMESAALDNRINLICNQEQRLSEISIKYQDFIVDCKLLVENLQKKENNITVQNEQRQKLLDNLLNAQQIYDQTKQKIQILKLQTNENSDKLEKLNDLISDENAQKNTLLQKIPALESDKKNAVSQRNFKAASQITNDIKDIQGQIEALTNNIKNQSIHAEQLKNQINNNQNEIQTTQIELLRIEEEASREKFNYLVFKEKDLQNLCEFTLEINQYSDYQILSVELNSVQQQIDDLITRYGFIRPLNQIITQPEPNSPKNEYQQINQPFEEEIQIEEDTLKQNEYYLQEEPEKTEENVEETNLWDIDEQVKQNYVKSMTQKIVEIEEEVQILNAKIEQFIEEENYEEADKNDSKIKQLQQQKEAILDLLTKLGFKSVEDANNFLNSNQNQENLEEVSSNLVGSNHEQNNQENQIQIEKEQEIIENTENEEIQKEKQMQSEILENIEIVNDDKLEQEETEIQEEQHQ